VARMHLRQKRRPWEMTPRRRHRNLWRVAAASYSPGKMTDTDPRQEAELFRSRCSSLSK
jgi:hypothetical protein